MFDKPVRNLQAEQAAKLVQQLEAQQEAALDAHDAHSFVAIHGKLVIAKQLLAHLLSQAAVEQAKEKE